MRVNKQWRYVIYKIADKDDEATPGMMHLEIDRCGLRDATFEDFIAVLPSDRARWIVYDFEYKSKEHGVEISKCKTVVITYNPDSNQNTQERSAIMFKKDLFTKQLLKKSGIKSIPEY